MLSESLTEKCVEYGASQLPAISEELSLKLNVSEATQEQLAKKKVLTTLNHVLHLNKREIT